MMENELVVEDKSVLDDEEVARCRKIVFSYGIYGREASTIPQEELKMVVKKPYTELLTPDELEQFKQSLTHSEKIGYTERTVPATQQDAICPSHLVRMKLPEWEKFIFGQTKFINNRAYVVLVDWLQRVNKGVSMAAARQVAGVDPKTIHYICKKLEEKGVIEEFKESGENKIRLLPLRDRHGEVKLLKTNLFQNPESPDTSSLVHFSNMHFLDQVRHHISQELSGISAKRLYELTGLTPKHGLKTLQWLCTKDSERFHMVLETSHRNRVLICYEKSNYERALRERLSKINRAGGHNTGDAAPLSYSISNEEKEAAIMKLAQKYKSFELDNEMFEELYDMTGWAYSFDRKTILRSALRAGLCVSKEEVRPRTYRYRIELENADKPEEGTASKQTHSRSFVKKVRYMLIKNPGFIPYDNGYRTNKGDACLQLLLELHSKHSINESFPLINSEFNSMPVRLIYYIFRIGIHKFAERAAQRVLEHMPSLLSTSSAATPQAAVGNMAFSEYLSLLPASEQAFLGKRVAWKRLDEELRLLEKAACIELSPEGKTLTLLDPAQASKLREVSLERAYAPLSIRESFMEEVLKAERSQMYEKALTLIRECDNSLVSRALFSKISVFLTDEMIEEKRRQSKRRKLKRVSGLCDEYEPQQIPKDLEEAYVTIKGLLISRELSGELLERIGIEQSERILRHMLRKRIIHSYMLNVEPPQVSLSSRFKRRFKVQPEYLRKYAGTVSLEPKFNFFRFYFKEIHKIVLAAKGRIDTAAILSKLHYIEEFELLMFLRAYGDVFTVDNMGKFLLVSLTSEQDPFSLGDV